MKRPAHIQFSFWAVVTLILAMGCGSMTRVTSHWKKDKEQKEGPSVSANYDKSSRIAYQLRNDDEYFYLDLQVANRTNQAKLVWSGLRVTVDTTGKRKNGLWFQFPFNPSKEKIEKERLRELMIPAQKGRSSGIAIAVEGMRRDAAFGIGGEIGEFNLDAIDAVFDARIKVGEAGILLYSIAIPFKRLPNVSREGLKNLSIGLSIEGINMPGNFQTTGASNGSRPGTNRAGTVPNAGTRASVARQAMSEPIKFWFVPDWASKP